MYPSRAIVDLIKVIICVASVMLILVLMLPSFTVAQEGNAICFEPGMCQFGTFCDPPENTIPGVINKPCFEIENGRPTTGICIAPFDCKATKTSAGKSPMDPSKLMEALKALMDALKGKKGGGGDKQEPPKNQDPFSQYPPCVKNEATNTTSPIPCKNPDGSVNYGDGQSSGIGGGLSGGGSTIADALLKALGGSVSSKLTGKDSGKDSGKSDEETGSDEESTGDYFDEITDEEKTGIGDDLINLPESEGGGSSDEDGGDDTKGVVSKGNQKTLQSSLVGDIFVGDSGATIFARSRDPGSNTEVAGFYGGGAFNAQASQSLVGRMCASRPWSTGFLASVIPPSFFDGLCRRAGYQVGTPAASSTGAPVKKVAPPKKTAPKVKAPPLPKIYPEVDIWAEPPNVRLGTRTYIFWTSSDVISCEATGPSFYQKSLSGGASTVPLSQATTFNIVCLTVTSTTVEDSVTVRLAL